MASLMKVWRVISAQVGELPLKEGGSTFKPSGYKRETQNGEVAENTGYVESPTQAVLKLKLNASVDTSVFRDITSDTLTIYLADRTTAHVMPNAWVTEQPELGNGEYDVTYESAKSQKIA